MSKKTVSQYTEILFMLMKDIEKIDIEKGISVYLQYLKKERSLYLLPNIVKSFETYTDEEKATIVTARPCEDKELKKIVTMLGENLNYNHEIDETLLGGFVAQTKSVSVDASIKQSLNRLHLHLVS